MRRKPPFEPPDCPEELLDRIEPYLDGELDPVERVELEGHLSTCPRCTAALAEARRVRDTLRALPGFQCPPRVLETVLEIAAAEGSSPRTEPLRPPHGWQRAPQRAVFWLAAAAIALAALGATLIYERTRQAASPTAVLADLEETGPSDRSFVAEGRVTEEEIARAEEEARLALALFAQVTDRVGRIVQEEVIGRRVSSAPSLALEAIRARTEVSQ